MKRIIVGISGATGVILGIRLLEVVREMDDVETHLIISESGKRNIEIETDYDISNIERMAHRVYDVKDMTAPVASGSFKTDGMIIIPCSIKTISAIANSYNENLIVRAADCILKEKRKLVAVVRETPVHRGHLELMAKVDSLGGVILPPAVAFYNNPRTVSDIINHIVGKALDQLGIDNAAFIRWKGID